jgi:hypothetical protein
MCVFLVTHACVFQLNTLLIPGNYAFDREGKFGSRFFCTQHFGLQGSQRMKLRRKSDEFLSGLDKENIPAKSTPKTAEKVYTNCLFYTIQFLRLLSSYMLCHVV